MSKKDEDLLVRARKRFHMIEESETDYVIEAKDDINFIAGHQWDYDVKNARDNDKRPCLVINRLPQFKRQVANDIRQNRPSIVINPVDDNADIETAKVLQGITRHIQYDSNADVAYDTAAEHAIESGRGFFRLVAEYVSPYSFYQCLKIKQVKDRFSCVIDPDFQEPDGSDAEYGFVFNTMTHDEYKRSFPNSKLANAKDWSSFYTDAQNDISSWIDKETVKVADYYEKVYEPITIIQYEENVIVKINSKTDESSITPPELKEIARRKSYEVKVMHYKLNGVEVLAKTEWPSQWIPIFPVIGDDITINGKRTYEGIIRHAKDSQRMYNYMASAEAESIALAPKAPWIVADGQLEGYENLWASSNQRNHAFLPYKAKFVNGQMAPAPQRNVYEPAVQAITNARMQASEDMKATTGIYDAALGNRSQETSGIAIQRRANQSQTSNFHFADNLARTQRHLGRVLVEMIPKIYDTPRAIRIIGEDDKRELIWINKLFKREGFKDPRKYDFSVGKYDVAVDVGPSYETKRQEAVGAMLEFTRAMPNEAPLIADLLVRNMDWPGSQQIADRLKKMLPPQLSDDNQEIPPQLQGQIQQMHGMIQQLTNELNQAQDALDQKKFEAESKERIELMKVQADLEKTYAKINADQANNILLQEIQTINQRLSILDFNQPIAENNESEAQQTSVQQPMGGSTPSQPMENP